jgi:hypothetical protein
MVFRGQVGLCSIIVRIEGSPASNLAPTQWKDAFRFGQLQKKTSRLERRKRRHRREGRQRIDSSAFFQSLGRILLA